MPVRRRKTKANATAAKKAEEVAAVAATVAGAAKKGSSNHDTVTLAGGQDKKKKSSKELTKLLQGLGLGSDTTPTTSPTSGDIKSTTEAVCAPAKYKCKNFETYESPDHLSEGAF